MMRLPKGMEPDRDNVVYFDTEAFQFYIIEWVDNGNGETAKRHYIELTPPERPTKKSHDDVW